MTYLKDGEPEPMKGPAIEEKNGNPIIIRDDKIENKIIQEAFDLSLARQAHYGKGLFGGDE